MFAFHLHRDLSAVCGCPKRRKPPGWMHPKPRCLTIERPWRSLRAAARARGMSSFRNFSAEGEGAGCSTGAGGGGWALMLGLFCNSPGECGASARGCGDQRGFDQAETLHAPGAGDHLVDQRFRWTIDFSSGRFSTRRVKYPARYWELDETGQPTQRIIETRRKAEFITPIPKPRGRSRLSLHSAKSQSVHQQNSTILWPLKLLCKTWDRTAAPLPTGINLDQTQATLGQCVAEHLVTVRTYSNRSGTGNENRP